MVAVVEVSLSFSQSGPLAWLACQPPWTLHGIVIDEWDALFLHNITDSANEDLNLTGAAHLLVCRDNSLVPKCSLNNWQWKLDKWHWKYATDLFHTMVNVIFCSKSCNRIDMNSVLEFDDPPSAAISSQVLIDAIAAWVQCAHHLSTWTKLRRRISIDCQGKCNLILVYG